MALALDEPNENDDLFEDKGYSFCINKKLLKQVSHVTIDYLPTGLSITPAAPLSGRGCQVNEGCSLKS